MQRAGKMDFNIETAILYLGCNVIERREGIRGMLASHNLWTPSLHQQNDRHRTSDGIEDAPDWHGRKNLSKVLVFNFMKQPSCVEKQELNNFTKSLPTKAKSDDPNRAESTATAFIYWLGVVLPGTHTDELLRRVASMQFQGSRPREKGLCRSQTEPHFFQETVVFDVFGLS